MKVVVLGAGVVGVTSAWYLCKAGHEVTVVERQPDVALETSYGNAGGVCPSFAGPWAAPGMPFKALKWMFQSTAPLKFRPKFDPYQWRWLAGFIENCTEDRFQENKSRMQRIAHYSRACLQDIRSELSITYENQSAGVLQIFQTESEVETGFLAAKVLSDLGTKHLIVDSNMAKELEPALAKSDLNIAGGLFMPEDETGDSRVFCKKMFRILRDLGVDFQFDTEILNFTASVNKIEFINTSKGQIFGDSFVAALGPYVAKLLRPLRINLPIYPVKGYSITGQIIDEDASPLSSVMDEHTKVMVTRLGNRLRAAGAAEIVGFDRTLPKSASLGVMNATKNLFPGAVDYNNCEVWCGFRPMTPDGPPKLGKTQFSNLFLNAGHGSNGWTQACGASKIVADILSNREPDIDISGLTYFDTF